MRFDANNSNKVRESGHSGESHRFLSHRNANLTMFNPFKKAAFERDYAIRKATFARLHKRYQMVSYLPAAKVSMHYCDRVFIVKHVHRKQ
jgi:hypothetical protein